MEGIPALEALDFSQLRNVTLNDRVLMSELVDALASDASQKTDALLRAVDAEDARECVRLAHALTGACGNVGALSMAALFHGVEREASRGDVRGCRTAVERIPLEIEKLRRAAELI
jgi:HPt (histidine-containing phosphotransfer) domain-containing protein